MLVIIVGFLVLMVLGIRSDGSDSLPRSRLTPRLEGTTGWYLALYQSTARRDPTLTHTLRCTAGRTLPLSTTGTRTVEITCRARL